MERAFDSCRTWRGQLLKKHARGMAAFFASVFIVGASALGADPIRLMWPTQEPDYLKPISPNDRKTEAYFEKLLDHRRGSGTMPFTLNIWAEHLPCLSGGATTKMIGSRENFITLVELAGLSRPERKKFDTDVAIDAELAIAVQRAWATMLLKTRFPEHPYWVADGSQIEFSVFVRGLGDIYGQASSPSKGFTKELMDIGFSLAEFTKLTEEERKEKRDALLKRLETFTRDVSLSPSN